MTHTVKYEPLPQLSECDPGIDVLEYNVLVLVKKFVDKTEGGVFLARTGDGDFGREEEAGKEGMLVGMSPMAFTFDDWPEGAPRPQAGDEVIFARYSGKQSEFEGRDGRTYRVMNDKDILGVRHAPDALRTAAE